MTDSSTSSEKNLRFAYSAPGKTIISGEHSVVYGKNALVMAIDLRTRCRMSLSSLASSDSENPVVLRVCNEQSTKSSEPLSLHRNDFVQVVSALSEENNIKEFTELVSRFPQVKEKLLQKVFLLHSVETELSSAASPQSDDDDEMTLIKQLSQATSILTIEIESTLPISKGLGSSASYFASLSGTAIRMSLSAGSKIGFDESTFVALANKVTLKMERIYHGNPSGIDNHIAIYGGILVFSKSAQRGLKVAVNALPYRILLIDTQVEKSTKKAVERVRQMYDCESLRSPTNNADSTIGKQTVDMIGDVTNQLIHLIETSAANSSDDSNPVEFNRTQFSDLIRINQSLLRLLDLSHASIEKLMGICMKHGVISKITGAGQGGNCVAFVPNTMPEELQKRFIQELEQNEYLMIDANLSVDGLRREE